MDNNTDKETACESSTEDDGVHQRVEKLLAQVTELQSEQSKFDNQRGKMKELFLQQQEERNRLQEELKQLKLELDEARSQVTVTGLDLESRLEQKRSKAQEELSSLQQLLSETLEVNTKNETELKLLQQKNEKLEAELAGAVRSSEGSGGLGGGSAILAMPTAMLSTIARKVACQLSSADSQQSAENLEESMRKAKEDAEVLRSLVLPLEEEITILKSKLRETQHSLKKYQDLEMNGGSVLIRTSPTSGAVGSFNADSTIEYEQLTGGSSTENLSLSAQDSHHKPIPGDRSCDMCINYEAQLVQVEAKCCQLEREVATLDRYKEELAKETMFRKEMEEKWTEKKEEHKAQVADLQNKMKAVKDVLDNLRSGYKKSCLEIEKQFKQLKEERRATQQELKRIEQENDNLMGKYNAHSRELQNEEINLPDNVESLQEVWLKQREELIHARVGQERLEESVKSLECLYNAATMETSQLSVQVDKLTGDLNSREKHLKQQQDCIVQLEQKVTNLQDEVHELRLLLQTVKDEKKKLEQANTDMKNRLVSLQVGLENGEAVQKDFVLLSQSLQKELENLRAQNNVLRWEYEEDVTECRGCEQQFKSSTKGKLNCRHCGKIFCINCLAHRVQSGATGKESRVCDVCHTLLNKESAPYFSTDHHSGK